MPTATTTINVPYLDEHYFDRAVQIENSVFREPWDREKLRVTMQTGARGYAAFLRKSATKRYMVGYCLFSPLPQCLWLRRLVVDPSYRREGIGGELLDAVLLELNGRRTAVVAEVAESQLAMQLFLRSKGFTASPSLLRERFGPGNDGIVFELLTAREASGDGAR